MERKFKKREELSLIIKTLKDMGYTIGLINGAFDLIHSGHIDIIEEAKRLCDILIIALNSDKSIAKLKGKGRPILTQKERIKILSAIEEVDFVTIFDEITASKTLKIIRPDLHIKGCEYRGKELPEAKITKKLNIKTILIGDKKVNSTTQIIKKIKNQ